RQLEAQIREQVRANQAALFRQAAERAADTGENSWDVVQQLVDEQVAQQLSAYGEAGDIQGLMRQASQLRAELGRLRAGTVSGVSVARTITWQMMSPEQKTMLAHKTKKALAEGQPVNLEALREAGAPVDPWVMEVQNGQTITQLLAAAEATVATAPASPPTTLPPSTVPAGFMPQPQTPTPGGIAERMRGISRQLGTIPGAS